MNAGAMRNGRLAGGAALGRRDPRSADARRDEPLPPAPLRFERRAAERWPAVGRLEAMRSDGIVFPTTIPIDLVNESASGLAAEIESPLPPGARLSVRTSPGVDVWRHGVVVRCEPTTRGYRLALAFERRRAA